MLFSKVKFFKINKDFPIDEKSLSQSLNAHLFTKIEKTQISTQGFVNPFNQFANNPVYGVSGSFLVTLREDSKSIPPSAVKRKTDYRVRELEKKKGEAASKEDKLEIKEQVLSEMISAFPLDFIKTKYINAIIFPSEQYIAIDSVSTKDCESMKGMLKASIGALPVIDYECDSMPSSVMTSWLQDEENVPDELTILQECQLKDDVDERGAVVHCKNQDLSAEEVESHLDAGKVAVMIAVEWNDSLKFKLKEDLTIQGISYSELMKERLKDDCGDGAASSRFDAELALTVESLRMLAPNILQIFA